ncbi:tail fiber assembly protein [Escherichia coli]|nr:tail fiber assembly protein [Escherichia coli]
MLPEAKEGISIWQSELLPGTISDEDRGSLAAWIEYIKELQQVTFTSVKDKDYYNALVWPESPSKGFYRRHNIFIIPQRYTHANILCPPRAGFFLPQRYSNRQNCNQSNKITGNIFIDDDNN